MSLEQAIAALRAPAGVALVPTSTLYGLSGRAADTESNHRIARIKQRPVGPLIVLVDRMPAGLAGKGLEAVWPGPVTVLVSPDVLDVPVSSANLGPDGRVAVRWDPDPDAQALIAAVGPITSTSANLHGEPPLRDPGACPFPVDAVIDQGVLPERPPSTLVDWDAGVILRAGAQAERVRELLAARQPSAS
ncbi:MAG: Sua5/YciO/YrdC/YwlC family protein [Myxococcota bacterium]|nr:Sua5/YciO/YrdC/YwlC family protein [Myxococcota bacterium]